MNAAPQGAGYTRLRRLQLPRVFRDVATDPVCATIAGAPLSTPAVAVFGAPCGEWLALAFLVCTMSTTPGCSPKGPGSKTSIVKDRSAIPALPGRSKHQFVTCGACLGYIEARFIALSKLNLVCFIVLW